MKISIDDPVLQDFYHEKTGKNAFWGGSLTQIYKDWIKENIEEIKAYIKSLKKTEETEEEAKEIEVKAEEKKEIPKIESKTSKKVVLSGSSKKKPSIFTSSFEDTWEPLIKKLREDLKKGVKRRKGVIIILSGETGAGKTHLAVDFRDVPEIELTYRIIPSCSPIYLIMTDPAPLDEVERNFKEFLGKDIFPVNCYVEDKITGLVDPIATLHKMNEFLSGLKKQEKGLVIIEDWTMYCAFVLFSYMLESGGKEAKGISFNEFMRPERQISPTEHQYKARLIDEILLSFQNSFMLNFILVANLKDEWSNTGTSLYDAEKTGNKIEDMQKGSDRKADVVVRMWKEELDGSILRKLIFKKSRFEGEVVVANEQVISSPTARKLMKTIVKLYLKGGL